MRAGRPSRKDWIHLAEWWQSEDAQPLDDQRLVESTNATAILAARLPLPPQGAKIGEVAGHAAAFELVPELHDCCVEVPSQRHCVT